MKNLDNDYRRTFMRLPVQITWRDMAPSTAVGEKIREEAAKLEEFYDRIMNSRVTIEIPRRYQNGKYQFHIRIDLTVPGAEIVVNHEPTLHSSLQRMDGEEHAKGQELSGPHKDVYVAIRDAFKVARRKLQEYSHRQNGAVKHHQRHADENLYNN
jgi:ribosome-associated translation inhibitor RaiA